MKLVLDENLSPIIAQVASLVISDSEFLAVAEWAGAGVPDEELFPLIAEAGGCLFTCDRNQRRTPKVREALRASAITVFFAEEGWSHVSRFEQVRRFLNWWPEMQRVAEANWPGSWFDVPDRPRVGRLTRLPNSPGKAPE